MQFSCLIFINLYPCKSFLSAVWEILRLNASKPSVYYTSYVCLVCASSLREIFSPSKPLGTGTEICNELSWRPWGSGAHFLHNLDQPSTIDIEFLAFNAFQCVIAPILRVCKNLCKKIPVKVSGMCICISSRNLSWNAPLCRQAKTLHVNRCVFASKHNPVVYINLADVCDTFYSS